MDTNKIDEVLERVKKGEASKEEILVLLKIMNISVEAYKALIEEVNGGSN